MFFNSYSYLFFFPIVCMVYFLLPKVNLRVIFLVLASYFFYMCWNPVYILLILLSTVVDYFIAQKIQDSGEGSSKKRWLFVSLLVNLGVLFYFKYYNFLCENIEGFFGFLNFHFDIPDHNWLLPAGISFYTFQTLSYTLDVYNNKSRAESNFWKFALYVSFFPQLVAGPIERSTNLLPQFSLKHSFDYKRVKLGCILILIGTFKKIVVADRFALYVDQVYSNPGDHFGFPIIMASIFFVFQIYCDFSGYSDVAIGSAKVLGFNLMDNFKGPLLSKNVTEIWRRWHISLSTWVRDYLYNPLLYKYRSSGTFFIHIVTFITFILVGVWHGANWTYIVFGFLQGIALSYELVTKKLRKKIRKSTPALLYNSLSIFITFCFWTFCCHIFRSKNISQAWSLFKDALTYKKGQLDNYFNVNIYDNGLDIFELRISLVILVLISAFQFIEYKQDPSKFVAKQHVAIRWIFYLLLIVSIPLLGQYGEYKQFIYFQF